MASASSSSENKAKKTPNAPDSLTRAIHVTSQSNVSQNAPKGKSITCDLICARQGDPEKGRGGGGGGGRERADACILYGILLQHVIGYAQHN